MILTEQKARVTYDNILRLCDDPDVRDPIKYLREREIVHYQRFADANLPHSNRFCKIVKYKKYEKIKSALDFSKNQEPITNNWRDRLVAFIYPFNFSIFS